MCSEQTDPSLRNGLYYLHGQEGTSSKTIVAIVDKDGLGKSDRTFFHYCRRAFSSDTPYTFPTYILQSEKSCPLYEPVLGDFGGVF